MTNERDQIG
jgi:hypothetical protein